MTRFHFIVIAQAAALAASLAACASLDDFASGDKVDYRSTATVRPTPLEVPPDLTQLSVDPRYAAQSISAAALQAPAASAPSNQSIAPQRVGDVRIERQGGLRWLSTSQTPDQLWPQLQAFWKERGLTLVIDQPDVGVMETDWAENRAKLPQDFIRRAVGKVLDAVYSTGELDKYRTRIERNGDHTEIYISHRGQQEVYANQIKDSTVWQPRPSDPLLEDEMLTRLMIKLGSKTETAKASLAQAAVQAAPGRARIIEGQTAATLQVDENFERAWRRVGLALDRSGFTIEDRDRAQGIYFVRYVDPAQAGKEEPGFFGRLFSGSDAKKLSGPIRYRVNVKGEGETTRVSVFDAKGAPENGEAGARILKFLVDDLK